MKSIPTLICAIPESCWNRGGSVPETLSDLPPLIQELNTIRRRIGKNVNPSQERIRYESTLARLDRWLLKHGGLWQDGKRIHRALSSGEVPVCRVGGEYFGLLSTAQLAGETIGIESETALGARVIAPDRVRSNLKSIRHLLSRAQPNELPGVVERQQFVRRCRRSANCGIVEIPLSDEAAACPDIELAASRRWSDRFRAWVKKLFAEYFGGGEESAEGSVAYEANYDEQHTDRGRLLRNGLASRIQTALAQQGSVSIGTLRHPLITDALAQFVTQRAKRVRPREVRLIHSDGSEGAPIVLNAVKPFPADWRPTRELHVGLISMRHLQLDRQVDMYWFRNLEVPRRVSNADASRYCFQKSIENWKRLRELYSGETVQIYLYHTGFMPAVIGFYQALVKTLVDEQSRSPSIRDLAANRNWFRVIPIFAPPENPDGALLEHGCPWPSTKRELESWTLESWQQNGKPPASIAKP